MPHLQGPARAAAKSLVVLAAITSSSLAAAQAPAPAPASAPAPAPASASAPEPAPASAPEPPPPGTYTLPQAPYVTGPSGIVPPTPTPNELPTAGYKSGSFFVRSQNDVFRVYIMGRVHADWVDQFGPGTSSVPPGSNINDGFFLRRARLELAGEFFQTWQWTLGAEVASSTSVDNPAAMQQQPFCTVNPTTGALPCVNQTSPAVENPTVKPIPTDVFVNYGPHPLANIQVGQFYVPFTLENRISDNTTPFLERSMAVRNIGVPLQRDIGAMAWGETTDKLFYYAVGFLNGDGPNRVNTDTRYEIAGRVLVRPLATSTSSASKWTQIGLSARQSSADPTRVGYDLPSMSTQGGFVFWKPTYKDSLGRLTHIIPSTGQWGLAADLYVPIENFDFTGEFMYVEDNTREALDGYQLSPFTERLGTFKGWGWYAQASYWLLGDHDIIGYPSYGKPIHIDLLAPQRAPQQGVQVLAKFEMLHMSYDGNARGGNLDAKTPNGDIIVNDFELGINYWATKHLRVGLNYTYYDFPTSEPVTPSVPNGPVQSSVQRAVAPAQLVAKGVDDSARDNGHTLHEFQARVGVQF